jgi:hypothetical protein
VDTFSRPRAGASVGARQVRTGPARLECSQDTLWRLGVGLKKRNNRGLHVLSWHDRN